MGGTAWSLDRSVFHYKFMASFMAGSAAKFPTTKHHRDSLMARVKWLLPSQPPPRLVAQKQSYEIESTNCPVAGPFVVETFSRLD
jgi:hypothetical protein